MLLVGLVLLINIIFVAKQAANLFIKHMKMW